MFKIAWEPSVQIHYISMQNVEAECDAGRSLIYMFISLQILSS